MLVPSHSEIATGLDPAHRSCRLFRVCETTASHTPAAPAAPTVSAAAILVSDDEPISGILTDDCMATMTSGAGCYLIGDSLAT